MTYNKNNIFAKIIRKEISCSQVYENQYALAFHDLHPAAPAHVLVIPKGEFVSFSDFIQNASADENIYYWAAIKAVVELLELEGSGYRLISNHGSDAMQTVPHFHTHILGRQNLGPLIAGDTHHT